MSTQVAYSDVPTDDELLDAVAAKVYRSVVALMLAGVLCKLGHFAFFAYYYSTIPLRDSFFPAWGQSTIVLMLAYLTVLVGGCTAMIARRRRTLFLQASTTCAALFVLCIHQGSYNDVTFLTALWSSIWAVWYTLRATADETQQLLDKAAFLANIILAMILLGGGVGKWTAEYWSGAVLYDIYFVDRDFWLFNGLRQWCDEPTLREIACWYSRFVVVLETSCFAALWFLPRRYASMLAIFVFASIALFSNFYLFSVLLSPIGLATVGIFADRHARTAPAMSGRYEVSMHGSH